MVEFALVAPLVLLILLILLDFGRGLFYYSEMAAGAREAAREGTLLANQSSNLAPAPSALPGVRGVVPQIQSLATFGYALQPYASCVGTQSGPSAGCGTYGGSVLLPNGTYGPGPISLAGGAAPNRVYVFVYELDPVTGATRWDDGTAQPVRTGGHRLVVVDLKLKWTPAVLAYAGLYPSLVFDAASAQREEAS
jgi:TadE-like protein